MQGLGALKYPLWGLVFGKGAALNRAPPFTGGTSVRLTSSREDCPGGA